MSLDYYPMSNHITWFEIVHIVLRSLPLNYVCIIEAAYVSHN